MIRVLIADDHPIVREGLKQVLGDAADTFEIGEARDGDEALRRLREGHWDVLLLDVTMPGMSSLEVLRRIREEGLGVRVLALSVHPEDYYGVQMLRAGAAGYITKESVPDELFTAILKVARGGKYITPRLAERLASTLDTDAGRPVQEVLTRREYEIFLLLGAGRSTAEIAGALHLSPKTVSTHRDHILKKLKLKNNAQLMYYCLQHGLLDGHPPPP